MSWGQAGGSVKVDPAGRWAASLTSEELETYPEVLEEIQQYEDNLHGDRRQEIVIITINNNESDIRARLDACLLTPEEMVSGREEWIHYVDNFPKYG